MRWTGRRLRGLGALLTAMPALRTPPLKAVSLPLLPALSLLAVVPALAQLAEPNAAGVAMGHLHFEVKDAAAERDFWVRLGGRIVASADGVAVAMPGVLIVIGETTSEQESEGASEEEGERESVAEAEATGQVQPQSPATIIDHVAFRVASLAAIAERGLELVPVAGYPGIASVHAPSGARVELFEEGTATNVGFTPAVPDALAERHNRPLAGAIDSHHLHLYLPEDQVTAARDWYAQQFGAVPGLRWRYDAADLPGMNLNFSAAAADLVSGSSSFLPHISFEVRDLEAFCRLLASRGIEFDQPFRRVGPAYAFATLTDPWGTTIELTEGLVP